MSKIKLIFNNFIKNKTTKNFNKNSSFYVDYSWYRSKSMKLWIYFTMSFFAIFLGIMMWTGNFTSTNGIEDSITAIKSAGISLTIFFIFTTLLISYFITIHKLTFKYFGNKDEIESLSNLSKNKYKDWKDKRTEINKENAKKYEEKKEIKNEDNNSNTKK